MVIKMDELLNEEVKKCVTCSVTFVAHGRQWPFIVGDVMCLACRRFYDYLDAVRRRA